MNISLFESIAFNFLTEDESVRRCDIALKLSLDIIVLHCAEFVKKKIKELKVLRAAKDEDRCG